MKILIADDSEFILDNLKKLLKSVSSISDIKVAKDVEEAIKKINSNDFDVLILDIKMPKGQGFDVLDVAKKQEKPPIVIMLTNFDLAQYKEKSFQHGADYFFDKSTEFESVIEVIDDLASKKLNK